jgi:ADP-ribose pyrophosphatase YjhB (NUDIX family)
MPVTQVYGIIFDHAGRMLLLQDGKSFTLPGGKPLKAETFRDTLQRECLEEAQVTLTHAKYLGFVHVREHGDGGGQEYAQMRMIGLLKDVLDSATDPDTGRMYVRFLMSATGAVAALDWGDIGLAQIRAETALLAQSYGISASLDKSVLKLEARPCQRPLSTASAGTAA